MNFKQIIRFEFVLIIFRLYFDFVLDEFKYNFFKKKDDRKFENVYGEVEKYKNKNNLSETPVSNSQIHLFCLHNSRSKRQRTR